MEKPLMVSCATVKDLRYQLLHSDSKALNIILTGKSYHFNQPLYIQKNTVFTSASTSSIAFSFDDSSKHFLELQSGCNLTFKNATIDLSKLKAKSFISTDKSGNSLHSKLILSNCTFIKSQGDFFSASKTSVLDTLLVKDCSFIGGTGLLFNMGEENDKKGYYNTEHFIIMQSKFNDYRGQLVRMLRSGTDESTMGPFFKFNFNEINTLTPLSNLPIISLNGVQQSIISNNRFNNCNPLYALINYEDRVSAIHLLNKNYFKNSGKIVPNKYVTATDNQSIQ
jgi:poly(beta-D-mannuronate) lyase